jgi:chromosome segregation ATPase
MTNELSQSYSKALELHNKILVSAQLAQNNLWDMCSGLKEMRDGKLYKELGYQNFEEYCQTEHSISRQQAHKYISIIENINPENVNPGLHFGVRKLYLLSTLSESEQEKITAENNVESMTVRQLEAEIRELKEKNAALKLDLGELAEEHERTCEQATADSKTISGLRQNISALNQTIEELEARPVEVAVAEPSDEVRQLKLTIKNLEKTTEDQLNTLQDNHLETEMKLRRENAEKLRQQADDYEKKLAEARQSGADDKQVFKAYFTAAFDAFNRMLEFAQKSEDKQFFKEKISSLISTVANANDNM